MLQLLFSVELSELLDYQVMTFRFVRFTKMQKTTM